MQVWDWEQHSRDRLIGSVRVPAAALLQGAEEAHRPAREMTRGKPLLLVKPSVKDKRAAHYNEFERLRQWRMAHADEDEDEDEDEAGAGDGAAPAAGDGEAS